MTTLEAVKTTCLHRIVISGRSMGLGIREIHLPEQRICAGCGMAEKAGPGGSFEELAEHPVKTMSLQELSRYRGEGLGAVKLREELAGEVHISRGSN